MNDPQISSCCHSRCLHGSPAVSPPPVCPRADVKDRLYGEALTASQAGSQRAKLGLLAAEELMVSSNAASVVRIKM